MSSKQEYVNLSKRESLIILFTSTAAGGLFGVTMGVLFTSTDPFYERSPNMREDIAVCQNKVTESKALDVDGKIYQNCIKNLHPTSSFRPAK